MIKSYKGKTINNTYCCQGPGTTSALDHAGTAATNNISFRQYILRIEGRRPSGAFLMTMIIETPRKSYKLDRHVLKEMVVKSWVQGLKTQASSSKVQDGYSKRQL